MPFSRLFLGLAVFASLLAGAGCASLRGDRDLTIYSLRPTVPPEREAAAPRVSWQLVVETPLASDALDTPNILVMPTSGVVEMYRGVRWNDAAPRLVRTLVVRALGASGRIVGVGNPGTGLRGDYGLVAELRDFQAEYRGGVAYAVVRLYVKLLDYAANRVIASRAFQVELPSVDRDIGSVVAAFEHAMHPLLTAVVAWTLEQGEKARTDRAASRL